ncbi:MAG TPA: hypothetical protein VK845_02720 [Gemmatimonadales bacterium]|nr:hypothetical protein [Gemmatimonadales bacterium]
MPQAPVPPQSRLLDRLRDDRPLVAVELRPPRSGMSYAESMDVWIDMYHSIQRLARQDTLIFLTDNAVGQSEEENLAHLTANLATDVDPAIVVPFLTCKHSLDYCVLHATRAASFGFQALTVVGGDRTAGPPRCVAHASALRQVLRERVPGLRLGGWSNPHRDPDEQVDFLLEESFAADFFLTQIVSHHELGVVERFLNRATQRGVQLPMVFGVFAYRSANPKTLARLSTFLPVPAEAVTREFEAGVTAEEMCVRTIQALRDLGATKVYVSNLGFGGVDRRYRRIMETLER